MKTIKQLVARLVEVISMCTGQIEKLMELGYDESMLERQIRQVTEIERKLERRGINLAIEVANGLISRAMIIMGELEKLELKYLVSYQAAYDLKGWIMNLDFGPWPEVEEAYGNWDRVRMNRNAGLEDVRTAYALVLLAIEVAEKSAAEIRVVTTFAPESPKRSYAKNRRFDTGPKKGSSAEIPNVGGTSRKARHQKRKQARLAKAS